MHDEEPRAVNVYPTELHREGEAELRIQWNDGQQRQYAVGELRRECPCATCREKRAADQQQPATELPVLSAREAVPLRIDAMKPVGNYAYRIEFSDGHNTGLYTFELLRSLGKPMA
jgi:DUF971 family protein